MSILCIHKIRVQGEVLLVYVYVDDLICMGFSLSMLENFRTYMKKTFEMNEHG